MLELQNPEYAALPDIVDKVMRDFEKRTGRAYKLFDYYGHQVVHIFYFLYSLKHLLSRGCYFEGVIFALLSCIIRIYIIILSSEL